MGTIPVLLALVVGVVCLLGSPRIWGPDFFNLIALPISLLNRLRVPLDLSTNTPLKASVTLAVSRTGAAAALRSYATVIGYGSMLLSDSEALQSFGRLAMRGARPSTSRTGDVASAREAPR